MGLQVSNFSPCQNRGQYVTYSQPQSGLFNFRDMVSFMKDTLLALKRHSLRDKTLSAEG